MNPFSVVAGFVGGVLTYGIYDYLTGEEEDVEDIIDSLYSEKGPHATAKFLEKEEWCDDLDEAITAVEDWEADNPRQVALYLKRAARKAAARAEAKAKAHAAA